MILGRLWGISAQLSALCFFYPPHSFCLLLFTFPLSQDTGESQCGNSSYYFFSISESPGWERGYNHAIGLCHSFCGRQTEAQQTPRPYLAPWAPTHVKVNTAIDSVDARPQPTVRFPLHRGYPATGTDWQLLGLILAPVTTGWPWRDQHSLNKNCLNGTRV